MGRKKKIYTEEECKNEISKLQEELKTAALEQKHSIYNRINYWSTIHQQQERFQKRYLEKQKPKIPALIEKYQQKIQDHEQKIQTYQQKIQSMQEIQK